MLLGKQKYDLTIEYKPGKDMIITNCLSHFPSHKENLPMKSYKNSQHVHFHLIGSTLSEEPSRKTLSTASPSMNGQTASTRSLRFLDTSGAPRMSYPLRMTFSLKVITYTSPKAI